MEDGGERRRRCPRMRLVENVENDLRKPGVRDWRKRAQDRKKWRGFVMAGRDLHEL